jgi:hypothetical protein
MEKVVSLTGEPLALPGEAVDSVVRCLERYLEMARSGEIHGVQIVAGCRDRTTYASFEGLITHSMIGRAECQKQSIIEFLSDGT